MANHYPIVLAHGITRPDYLLHKLIQKLPGAGVEKDAHADRFHYFRWIATTLREQGIPAYHANVSFAARLSQRASDLAAELDRICAEAGTDKVHIIGHSMGGLDARHMITRDGRADRVASLTTIGTPHLGSVVAEWVLEHGGDQLIEKLQSVIDLEGVRDLTREACAAFNREVEAAEAANEVVYSTWAAVDTLKSVFLPLRFTWEIIDAEEGPNDGLVSLQSQKWVPELRGKGATRKQVSQHEFPVAADHVNQIGWWHVSDLFDSGVMPTKVLSQKREYEARIREIYVQIARESRTLPASRSAA